MEIHLWHAQSLDELVLNESHKPFRALANPLDQAGLRAEKETQHHKQVRQAGSRATLARPANLPLCVLAS